MNRWRPIQRKHYFIQKPTTWVEEVAALVIPILFWMPIVMILTIIASAVLDAIYY